MKGNEKKKILDSGLTNEKKLFLIELCEITTNKKKSMFINFNDNNQWTEFLFPIGYNQTQKKAKKKNAFDDKNQQKKISTLIFQHKHWTWNRRNIFNSFNS